MLARLAMPSGRTGAAIDAHHIATGRSRATHHERAGRIVGHKADAFPQSTQDEALE